MVTGTIFKIKKYALHDGPGIRTTVFLKGCPLRCAWCHNPEGMDPYPQAMSRRSTSGEIQATVGQTIGVDELAREIEKDQLFYDESGGGATFSGGEPLAQPDFLEALLAACREREIHTTLDTSGYAPGAVVERLLPRVDLVLFDIKQVDDDMHRRWTGVSNKIILDNFRRVAQGNTPLRVRLPLIAGVNDGEDNIDKIVSLSGTVNRLSGIDLLPFHAIGAEKYRRLGLAGQMETLAAPTEERLAEIQTRLKTLGCPVTLGG